MIAILVIWNILLTWYVFQHVKTYNDSMYKIAKVVPGLRIKRRR